MSFAVQRKLVSQVWSRNYSQFKRTWVISLFWAILEPIFMLTALGYGLGSLVPTVEGKSYVEFFFPGLICSSSMLIAFFASTYDVFSKLTHQRLFQTQILTPIEPREIVIGEVLWAASKGLFSAVGISVVASFFGLTETLRIFPALLMIFLSCLVFASFGMLVSTYVRNFDEIIFPTSGFIIPMSLLSGVYFPIDQLPYGLQYAVYIFPLTHSVRAVRALVLQGFDWWMLANIFYLIVLVLFLMRLSIRRLSRKLLST
jgi:lipooligosaccharide transport system permease protein